jgi:hypothetical protein
VLFDAADEIVVLTTMLVGVICYVTPRGVHISMMMRLRTTSWRDHAQLLAFTCQEECDY